MQLAIIPVPGQIPPNPQPNPNTPAPIINFKSYDLPEGMSNLFDKIGF